MSGPSADLALTPEDLDAFTREISIVFREYEAARLLRLVGFDRGYLPDFRPDNHRAAWAEAFRAIEDGLLATPIPYRELLRYARERYPGNAVFRRIEARYVADGGQSESAPPPPTARRVHVMHASPRDRDRLHGELRAIRAAAAPQHIVVTDSPDAGLLDLRALLEFRPDILHICGHGERGLLLFEDTYGDTDAVPAAQVVELLTMYRGAAGVRLSGIVLNSCDSATVAARFRPVAAAVIAHEGPLENECAVAFSGELYTVLRTVPDPLNAATVAAGHLRRVCPQIAENLVCLPGEP
jgi:hypothetical protein